MPCDHLLSVRVDDAPKQRFHAAAVRQGLSESALLKQLLELAMLATDASDSAGVAEPSAPPVASPGGR